MSIEELQKKLYRPGAEFENQPEAPETFEPGRGREYHRAEKGWNDPLRPIGRKWQLAPGQKKSINRWLILGSVLAVLIAGFLIWRNFFSFDRDRVLLKIVGPERIVSGEEIIYVVQYKNISSVSLKNINLSFDLPEGGVFADGSVSELHKNILLADVAAKGEAQTDVRVQIMGLKGNIKKVTAKLSYQPGNIKSSFENRAEFTSNIISVPLVLDFDLPEKVVNSQLVKLTLRYLNTSDAIFSDLKLKVDYPGGFTFDSAYPDPSEDKNIWGVSQIGGKEEGRVVISGLLAGRQDENKQFKAQLGIVRNNNFIALAEALGVARVSVPPLNLIQQVNGQGNYNASPGETLTYAIKYQNTTDVGINNATITAKMDSGVLDFSTVQAESGFFNSSNKTIAWNASSLRQLEFLAPHSEGEIRFSVTVKDKGRLPINDFSDKNFLIISTVKIDSSNVPLSLAGTQVGSENRLEIKLNSYLSLSAKGYFQDDKFSNNGPMPPKVGEMTTYTLYWYLNNTSNDLDDVQVRTYLPSYIHWMNEYEPNTSEIKYEPSTGKLTWNVGRLPAATGVLSPVKYVAFRVGLVPSTSQIGNIIHLINDSKADSHDNFTDTNLAASAEPVNSDLPDDPTVNYDRGKIVQ